MVLPTSHLRKKIRGPIAALAVMMACVIFTPSTTHAACSNPAGVEGEIIHNDSENVPQYCDDTNWIPLTSFQTFTSDTCVNIGDVCNNGMVYAGLSPDGNVRMYTTPDNAPGLYTWNDGSTLYIDTAMQNCNGLAGAEASCETGEANTALLLALNGTGSPAPYLAAEYCGNLSTFGFDDWYLPAIKEIDVIYTNRVAIGNYTGPYWQSSERSGKFVNRYFTSGSTPATAKDSSRRVRCVRKDNPSLTEIVPSGLIGHWRLDETSGTTATDSSGNGNDGTMTGGLDGATNSVSGQIDTALDFDGTDDDIDVGDILDSSPNLTVMAWVKADAFPNTLHGIANKVVGTGNRSWVLRAGDTGFQPNQPQMVIRQSNQSERKITSSTLLDTGKWYHVAGNT